jgi:CubicO group peptidase (beta-lactamase class C family)
MRPIAIRHPERSTVVCQDDVGKRPLRSLRMTILALAGAASLGAQTRTDPPNAKVDALFAQWNKPTSPGCVLGVVRDGKFIYQRGYGMANLDYDIPNSPRMVYYVGSDSKQFTAAAIAMLVLEGKVKLDDDVRKYVPELPDYSKTYGTPVTINHLVHHTSGIRDIYTLMELGGIRMEDVMPDDVALGLIARQKELNFTPGSDYLYSNSGYWLLGQIVRRVTGKSLRAFADERIFRPLGMTHTHFHDDPGHVMKNRAMSYMPDSGGTFRISYLQNFDKIGAGGLYTTIDDLRKWDENYYTRKVGGDALQALIHTRGVLTKGDTLTYAFGNEVGTYRGLRVDEHGGSLMGYKAHLVRFPDQRFTVIETCNLGTINPGPIAHQIADLYLGDKMKAPTPATRAADAPRASGPTARASLTAGELTALAGDYYSDELDATYHLVVEGDHLVLRRANTQPVPLEAIDANTFRAGGFTLHFEQQSGARSFTIEAGRVRNIRFRRR